MKMEPEEQSETLLLRPGKDEMNFAEFPIALLTDRVPKGQKSIKFEDEVYDERRKKYIPRCRIIEGSEQFGLPTATDDTVILALIQLSKQKTNFASREVEFTRLELIKMLGWPNEGKSYERIKLSLLRITNVTYNYVNAWWDPRQKSWTTRAFHIIDSVEINDSRASSGQAGLFPSRIVWGDAVFDSFQAGFLRNLDFQLCMRLEHPIALRMYRFLGKRFHHKADWEFDLKEFAYIHLNLGRNYEGGTQIARKLKPAILELEEIGFLEPLSEKERFNKQGREWTIRFLQKSPGLAVPALAETPMVAETPALVQELLQRGVTEAVAVELVQQHAARIEEKIAVFDWLKERKDKAIAKNPAGYLVKSIQKDYTSPPDYVSPDERRRRQDAKQARERQAANEQQRKQEAKAREQAERQAITAYWDALTPQQQAELDAAALAEADPATLALEQGPFKQIGQRIRRDTYIHGILQRLTEEA